MKSDGERLFAAYLRQRRLGWQYEPEIGGRRPDFLVEHPVRSFVAEVYEPQIRLPPGGGSFESYSALRSAFEGRKSKQISAVKRAGLTYVAVVASTNSDIRIQPLVVAGAMFGNLAVTLRVGPEVCERPDGRTVFGGGGRVQARQFRGVSAVAILERFNPTQDRLEAATRARLARLPDWYATMTPRQIAETKAAVIKLSRETAAAAHRRWCLRPVGPSGASHRAPQPVRDFPARYSRLEWFARRSVGSCRRRKPGWLRRTRPQRSDLP